jgi:hypothetical protein
VSRYLPDLVDADCIAQLCRDVTSPATTSQQVRLLHTLLTVELIFQQLPGLTRKVCFTNGPVILH